VQFPLEDQQGHELGIVVNVVAIARRLEFSTCGKDAKHGENMNMDMSEFQKKTLVCRLGLAANT
jgi:hypothetical protein